MTDPQPADSESAVTPQRQRRTITVTGLVQGVGFRPFVYALACELGVSGSVRNTASGVVAEVEGSGLDLDAFIRRLRDDAPPLALVESVQAIEAPVRGGTDFTIAASDRDAPGRTFASPDVATCADCLRELADPADRRHRHPFISCTNCGPRFTVIRDLPYDRPATTMADLPLCSTCTAEYADPTDRRFHAQTVACPDCGPTLRLERSGVNDLIGEDAVAAARSLLGAGAIVAVKGLGGYHLACNAEDETAVATLRKRKDRGDKPFAVMVADLDAARAIADVGVQEARLLQDQRRPVVLLRRRTDAMLAASVAPGHPDLGVMLAYTPVHHLLLGLRGDRSGPGVLVMTSGNLRGEPIVTDDVDARTRLGSLADAWLTNDRPIHVPCDDSVVRVVGGGTDSGAVLPVRRSRGYAPLPVALPVQVHPALAIGGDLKNTFCTGEGGYAWLSAHVGDMADVATLQAFEAATDHLARLTGVRAERLVADAHPRYRSTAWANDQPMPVTTVQHHHAHIASAMADAGHDGSRRVIGFAFDGTGYGTDGAIWGGEVLLADYAGFERVAHLRYVPLPGGDAGVRNPCRMALSHLRSAGLAWDPRLPAVAACSANELSVLATMLERGLQCTPTSSMGRLFDAVSSLVGVCHRVAYEAEAAMLFEELARDAIESCGTAYAFGTAAGDLDPAPVLAAVVDDVLAGVSASVIAARFHHAVADAVLATSIALRTEHDLGEVALSGGVFLNVVLTQLCDQRLRAAGFGVLRHRQVPPSDAGLALGQLVVGARIDDTDRPTEMSTQSATTGSSGAGLSTEGRR